MNEGIQPPPKRKNAKQWKPIFMPKQFVSEHEDLEVDNYKLSENMLKKYAIQISEIRKTIRENALRLDGKSPEMVQDKQHQTTRLAKKMSRW